MAARNGQHGYGWVTRLLHWLTVALLVSQVLVGYLLVDYDGPGEAREERLEERADRVEERDEAAAERLEELADRSDEVSPGAAGLADALEALPLHVALGLGLLLLTMLRLLWRRVGGLPPWDESLTPAEQRATGWIERALLLGLVAAPLSGLLLVGSADDDLVWLHVASHLWLYAAVAAHLALVVGRRARGRPSLLPRMVRGSR